MSKIAVVGDLPSILGFKSLGIDTYQVATPWEVVELWPTVLDSNYAVIMLTEPVFEAALDLVKKLEARVTPAVLAIPSTAGTTGAGKRYIRDLTERAVGAVIERKGEKG